MTSYLKFVDSQYTTKKSLLFDNNWTWVKVFLHSQQQQLNRKKCQDFSFIPWKKKWQIAGGPARIADPPIAVSLLFARFLVELLGALRRRIERASRCYYPAGKALEWTFNPRHPSSLFFLFFYFSCVRLFERKEIQIL